MGSSLPASESKERVKGSGELLTRVIEMGKIRFTVKRAAAAGFRRYFPKPPKRALKTIIAKNEARGHIQRGTEFGIQPAKIIAVTAKERSFTEPPDLNSAVEMSSKTKELIRQVMQMTAARIPLTKIL